MEETNRKDPTMPRISAYQSPPLIRNLQEFANPTGSFRGVVLRRDSPTATVVYGVYSYRTLIAEFRDGAWWFNATCYSVTTSRHQSYVRSALHVGYSGDPGVVTVVRVPRGASNLSRYAGRVAHERAARLARAFPHLVTA